MMHGSLVRRVASALVCAATVAGVAACTPVGAHAPRPRARRRSVVARFSRPTIPGTPTSRTPRCGPTPRSSSRTSTAAAASSCTPTSVGAGSTGSRSASCPRTNPCTRSTTPRTVTRATPDRSRSRPARPSKAARRARVTVTSSSCSRAAAISTSSVGRSGRRQEPLERDGWRQLGPRVERAAAARMDLGRRRRLADPSWPRPLRRGRGRRDRPRIAIHGGPYAEGLRLPGDPRRVVQHRPDRAADGAPPPAEGQLRPHPVPRRIA